MSKFNQSTHLVKTKFKTGLLFSALFCSSLSFAALPENVDPVKNVIFLIPDGMSITTGTLARKYHDKPLALDPYSIAMIKTWSSDGTIADSAPAGTALATGWKSQTGNIGSTGVEYLLPGIKTPSQVGYSNLQPVATLLEAARLNGKATGIVSTSEFMHATPADFTSHDPSRQSYDNLTEQIIHNKLDVILGGGIKYMDWHNRADKEDMRLAAEQQGFEVIDTRDGLLNFKGDKVLGVFGADNQSTSLTNFFDRDETVEPSLKEMTETAIEVLSKKGDGFVLMVEGSKIDWSAHANDPIGLVSEVTSFNGAVEAALEFAKQDGNTLVISVADHGNSGVTIIGNGNIDKLKDGKITAEKFAKLVQAIPVSADFNSAVRALIAENYAIDDVTDAEIAAIKANPSYGVGPVVARHANITFTTNGHTGEDIVLYSFDPRGKPLTGLVDNTDVAIFLAKSLDVDLAKATETLFINAKTAFESKGATVSLIEQDKENPYLEVTKGDKTIQIPRNRNMICVDGKRVESPSVNVFNGKDWFVSQSVIDSL